MKHTYCNCLCNHLKLTSADTVPRTVLEQNGKTVPNVNAVLVSSSWILSFHIILQLKIHEDWSIGPINTITRLEVKAGVGMLLFIF